MAATAPNELMHISFKSILVPTDFSLTSDLALSYADAMARRHGARVSLAHIIPDQVYEDIPPEQRDRALGHAQAMAEGQITGLKKHAAWHTVSHEIVIEHGKVWPILTKIADKHHVDLIVVGTHGREGFQKLLSGSTAEQIIRLARRPVLTVGPHCAGSPDIEPTFDRILYASDLSRSSVRALDYAISLAKKYEARFFFLHVSTRIDNPHELQVRSAEFLGARLAEFGFSYSGTGIEPEYLVNYGDASKAILAAAEERHASIIVLGMRSTAPALVAVEAHLSGPVPYSVAAQSLCPVLTVRDQRPKSAGRRTILRMPEV